MPRRLLFAWLFARLLVPLLVLPLVGCGPSGAERALGAYVADLRGATSAPVPASSRPPSRLVWYPSPEARRLELEDHRVGFSDYRALRACALDDLIGYRNSILGRVMLESSRLVYEHRMLGRLQRCREQPEAPSLPAQLDALIASKRDQLPRVLWNATFGSRELAKFFGISGEPLDLDAGAMSPEIAGAFDRLVALSPALGSPSVEISQSELEQAYAVLQSRPYGGELLETAELLGFYLDDASRVLAKTRANGSVCRSGARVFEEHYRGRLEPFLAQRRRDGRKLLELMDRLAKSIELLADRSGELVVPPEVASYLERYLALDREGSLWRRFERSADAHVRAWETVLGACGQPPSVARPF